jgi:hypothetical protein
LLKSRSAETASTNGSVRHQDTFATDLLKWVENALLIEARARLTVKFSSDGPEQAALIRDLNQAGLKILRGRLCLDQENSSKTFEFEVSEKRRPRDIAPPLVALRLAAAGALRLEWVPDEGS